MTDEGVEDECAHGGPGLQECCKLRDATTPWLSSPFQSTLLHQTTGQCEEQILWRRHGIT